jgi:hypothetical protein
VVARVEDLFGPQVNEWPRNWRVCKPRVAGSLRNRGRLMPQWVTGMDRKPPSYLPTMFRPKLSCFRNPGKLREKSCEATDCVKTPFMVPSASLKAGRLITIGWQTLQIKHLAVRPELCRRAPKGFSVSLAMRFDARSTSRPEISRLFDRFMIESLARHGLLPAASKPDKATV